VIIYQSCNLHPVIGGYWLRCVPQLIRKSSGVLYTAAVVSDVEPQQKMIFTEFDG